MMDAQAELQSIITTAGQRWQRGDPARHYHDELMMTTWSVQ